MEEGSAAGGESSSSASRVKPSFVKLGDRQIFTVELRPGETTFVSWKKLVKDANKANKAAAGGGSGPSAAVPAVLPMPPPAAAHLSLDSRIAPGQPAEAEANEAAAPHRFSAVIEKIERLYMGKDSSDEEDLKDVPDDDQYDTEDSFIDDAELDEYFEVDNSAIKHDGFFVNRGKLERKNEPIVVTNQQPKKRQRKDATRSSSEGGDALVLSKHVKQVKLAAVKTAHGTSGSSQILVATDEHYNDAKPRHPSTATDGNLKRKSAETRTNLDTQSYVKVSNGSDPISLAETREIDKPKTVNLSAKNPISRHKDASGPFDAQHLTYQDKNTYTQSRLQSTKPINSNNETDGSLRSKEKNSIRELPDLNSYPESKVYIPVTKATYPQRRDGSGVKPKSSMLEKSIRELEKMVAESRPPSTGNAEADTSSQAVKRRLPQEIKLKLAKVARLAGREGRIPKELLNRLMSILGHLIQLRTLKRNMKDMISMGMRAKEEKDDMFQQIKKEVVDMIKTRVPSLESKAFDQAGGSDDFQELGSEEKGSLKQKLSMDAVLEDKICDLYDLFVDGLDEGAGPQVRKLYVELAGLWPTGFMDNHGIKRAVCRAKERRKAMYTSFKDDEKLKRKKTLTPKVEETVQVDAGSVPQPLFRQDRPAPDTGSAVLALASKSVSSATASASRLSSPLTNAPVSDRQKPEKQRAISNNPTEEAKMGTATEVALAKKKVKRKPEQEIDESRLRTDKLHSQSTEDRHKSPKHGSGADKLHSQSS